MVKPLQVFVGYDPRQPLAYNVLQHSISRHSSKPVSITMLKLDQLPITRRGLTEFTFSRFLVPYLCGYEGTAVFMDADIIVKGDVADLFAQADGVSSVQVQQDQERFEWPSVMLFNNEHCKTLTPDYVNDKTKSCFQFEWGTVGKLPAEWNHCVGYQQPKEAKLYHFTQGIPCWYEVMGLPEDEIWQEEARLMSHTVGWTELMGESKHAPHVIKRLLDRLGYAIRMA